MLEGVLVIDQRGDIKACSESLARLAGRSPTELAGEPVWSLLPGWSPFGEPAGRGRLRVLGGRASFAVDLSRQALHLPGETLFMIEVRGRDSSAARVREIETLRHAATHDGLTGLPNRGLFLDRLEQSLRRASRREEAFALAVADIDRFKGINDRFGHSAGDAVLQAVAGRLSQCVREADTVSRLGGDEFGVILAGAGTRDAAAAVLGKVVASGSLPIRLDGGRIAATLSVGAVLFPGDGVDGEELRARADSAMYRAKRAGGGALRFYRQALASLPRRLCPDA